jgi:hypothetical protein
MNKSAWLICLLCFLICCGPKHNEVERIIEDGVEVIINHLEPYKINGETTSLTLEKEFTIDLEEDVIVVLGLTEPNAGVDVDSKGNIYLFQQPKGDNHFVFKFDSDGNYVTSFGQKGQGPGEFQYAWYMRVTSLEEIAITAINERKLIIFDNNGEFKEAIALNQGIIEAFPLENGYYLIKKMPLSFQNKYLDYPLYLSDSNLVEIKELDKFSSQNDYLVDTIEYPNPSLFQRVINEKIYIGNPRKGYEIFVYNLEGDLLKKISKEYEPVEISGEERAEIRSIIKKGIENPNTPLYGKEYNILKYWPPFQYLFTDDDGQLFVMTYEEGEDSGHYLYDIFNPDGLFIGRVSLSNLISPIQWDIQYVVAKNNRLHCLREKESGYKELVVYKMNWE